LSSVSVTFPGHLCRTGLFSIPWPDPESTGCNRSSRTSSKSGSLRKPKPWSPWSAPRGTNAIKLCGCFVALPLI
jgi:hypothetical protein